MASMLLDRPVDEILATNMPPNRPGPGGDEAETGADTEREDDEDDESEST